MSGEFRPLPDFSARLAGLLRAYGMTANSLSSHLRAVGVQCSPQHAYRVLNGSEHDPDHPGLSAVLLAGIIHVCPVDSRYFLAEDVKDIDAELNSMYVRRTSTTNRRPGPRPGGR